MRRSNFRNVLLLLFFALYFYRIGAANVEALLNYPFWLDMGRMMSNADFVQLRTDHIWKIFPLLVAPIGLLVIVTATLAVVGAPPVPRWYFGGAFALQSLAVLSTMLVQLPIQMQLDSIGYDGEAIRRLIATDLLYRKLPSLIEGVLVIAALWRVINARLPSGPVAGK